jgi:ribonuclease HI
MTVSNAVILFASAANPLGSNQHDGGYAAVIVHPGQSPAIITGTEFSASESRLTLAALIQALDQIPRGVPIAGACDDSPVEKVLRLGWLEGWRKRKWLTSAGRPVREADRWRELQERLAGGMIVWGWTALIAHAITPLDPTPRKLAGDLAHTAICQRRTREAEERSAAHRKRILDQGGTLPPRRIDEPPRELKTPTPLVYRSGSLSEDFRLARQNYPTLIRPRETNVLEKKKREPADG